MAVQLVAAASTHRVGQARAGVVAKWAAKAVPTATGMVTAMVVDAAARKESGKGVVVVVAVPAVAASSHQLAPEVMVAQLAQAALAVRAEEAELAREGR